MPGLRRIGTNASRYIFLSHFVLFRCNPLHQVPRMLKSPLPGFVIPQERTQENATERKMLKVSNLLWYTYIRICEYSKLMIYSAG